MGEWHERKSSEIHHCSGICRLFQDLPPAACRLFIVPSAVHLMLRFSAILSATTALCERVSIFISASWVLKDKYYIVFIILAQKNRFVKPFCVKITFGNITHQQKNLSKKFVDFTQKPAKFRIFIGRTVRIGTPYGSKFTNIWKMTQKKEKNRLKF